LGLANIASSRHELEARTAELRCHLPELEAKARCALRAGRQDVARHALERRQIAAGELALLNEQLREADLEATRLAAAEQQLAARIDAILARERMIEARQSVAEIQVRVGEALAGISGELAGLAPELAQAEEHAEALEARAAAIDRMLDLGRSAPKRSTRSSPSSSGSSQGRDGRPSRDRGTTLSRPRARPEGVPAGEP